MQRKNIVFLAIVVAVVVLDQASKFWVFHNLDIHGNGIVIIPGFFEIVHAQNPGAALGILRDFAYRNFVFVGFTAVAVAIIANMQRQLEGNLRFLPAVLALIMGGALGNGIDRLHKQTVTDFLRFFTEDPGMVGWLAQFNLPAEYPSFNIADSALVIGVGLFVIHYLFLDDGELDGKTAEETAEPGPSEEVDVTDAPTEKDETVETGAA